MVHEYPLQGKPPMMTPVLSNASGKRIVAAKGAPEAILAVSNLSASARAKLSELVVDFGAQGYRLLGVAKATCNKDDFPKAQQDFPFEFLGFTAFYDPPKDNIAQVFQKMSAAGHHGRFCSHISSPCKPEAANP